eukprot:gnl/MRDRNA2_/MRDRNA2_76964_c0_seq1.p1 gnl/MRDRNA2_/MRDRNA2_76964_c0~~gnl/MRDRNA2_/MRDRNA2_76964_c0_seq1.p1  ORF type:complete len:585 (+),score=93.29 gnl/MRDRNA2_/MRDRNA2_76964_c0_seq1:98-1852(+)
MLTKHVTHVQTTHILLLEPLLNEAVPRTACCGRRDVWLFLMLIGFGGVVPMNVWLSSAHVKQPAMIRLSAVNAVGSGMSREEAPSLTETQGQETTSLAPRDPSTLREEADLEIARRMQEEEWARAQWGISRNEAQQPEEEEEEAPQEAAPAANQAPEDDSRLQSFLSFQREWEDEMAITQAERWREEANFENHTKRLREEACPDNCTKRPRQEPVFDSKTKNATKSLLVESLECTVCAVSPMQPPIQQCRNGHLLCAACRKKVLKCPTCRIEPPWSRCLTLERLAEMVTVPCPISPACCLRFWPQDVDAHKDVCEFTPVMCPFGPSCNALLPMIAENISQHLVTAHRARRNTTELPAGARGQRRASDHLFTSRVSFNLLNKSMKMPVPELAVSVTSALGTQFFTWFEEHDQYFHAWMQVAGPRSAANEFTYKICWEHKSHTLCYKGPMWSVVQPARSIQENGEFLSIPKSLATPYISSSSNGSAIDLNIGIMRASDESLVGLSRSGFIQEVQRLFRSNGRSENNPEVQVDVEADVEDGEGEDGEEQAEADVADAFLEGARAGRQAFEARRQTPRSAVLFTRGSN